MHSHRPVHQELSGPSSHICCASAPIKSLHVLGGRAILNVYKVGEPSSITKCECFGNVSTHDALRLAEVMLHYIGSPSAPHGCFGNVAQRLAEYTIVQNRPCRPPIRPAVARHPPSAPVRLSVLRSQHWPLPMLHPSIYAGYDFLKSAPRLLFKHAQLNGWKLMVPTNVDR